MEIDADGLWAGEEDAFVSSPERDNKIVSSFSKVGHRFHWNPLVSDYKEQNIEEFIKQGINCRSNVC